MNPDEETAPVFSEDRDMAIRLVEAMIFTAVDPLPIAAIQERLQDGFDATELIDELQDIYRGRGINLVPVAGGWIFRTAPDLAGRLTKAVVQQRKLGRAQIETLAIVAYHQPVTRAEIEEIRGVGLHKGTLDLLMETGWVQPKGRREAPGRPVLWVTTELFLRHFGLNSPADLPNLEELKAAGLLDKRPVQTLGEPEPEGPDHGTLPEEY